MEHTLQVHMEADVLPGPIRIKADGYLTAGNCPILIDALEPALALQGCPSVTIDLVDVAYTELDGIQHLEHYVSGHNTAGRAPKISIVAAPDMSLSSEDSKQATWKNNNLEPSQRTTIEPLVSPIALTVRHNQLLQDIAPTIKKRGEPVVVVDDAGQPVSIITEADIHSTATDDPEGWHTIPCCQLADSSEGALRMDHPLADVLWMYQQGCIRPMLVFSSGASVGVLHPTSVFQWCAENSPALLSILTQRALENVSGFVRSTQKTQTSSRPVIS